MSDYQFSKFNDDNPLSGCKLELVLHWYRCSKNSLFCAVYQIVGNITAKMGRRNICWSHDLILTIASGLGCNHFVQRTNWYSTLILVHKINFSIFLVLTKTQNAFKMDSKNQWSRSMNISDILLQEIFENRNHLPFCSINVSVCLLSQHCKQTDIQHRRWPLIFQTTPNLNSGTISDYHPIKTVLNSHHQISMQASLKLTCESPNENKIREDIAWVEARLSLSFWR